MTHVFVSMPSWVAPEFQDGLTNFLRLLPTLEMAPRSLGTIDRGTAAPLDDVIRIMRECSGAVILGYPQIEIQSGSVKGQAINGPLILATEWNHLEAGLARAQGLPLLVIHHPGVQRGIFDRGALGAYLYDRDLTDPAWPLGADIQGALATWRASASAAANSPPRGVPAAGGAQQARVLTAEEIGVLLLVARAPDGAILPDVVARRLGMSEQRATYYLEGFQGRGMIDFTNAVGQTPGFYLEATGREALFRLNLI